MKYILSKPANLIKTYQYHIFLSSCIILIAVISYNLGQINSLKKTSISIKESSDLKADTFNASSKSPGKGTGRQEPNSKQTTNSKSQSSKLDTRVVVSKNSDKYHYSWCPSGKRIKPENQIWFNSAQEAESRGYVLAGNCQP